MPRKPVKSEPEILDAAMRHFWQRGYNATSMDELVDRIGVSRHAIYSHFGSKHELYLRCFDAYQSAIVDPAFEPVETATGGIATIEDYFETQISLAEKIGLPGPGCFVANAATETAPHDQLASDKVDQHHRRLRVGFARALSLVEPQEDANEVAALAELLVTCAQGLWSMSRTATSAKPLRRQARTIVSLIKSRDAHQ
ncbi:TetR/AcrR family transcriptional regulator [Parerythrobacter jejuensis]|uniref:TetR family transcriptional regulator n=1 Tax=Parerythrobacter jejuensis TaxID=795812 RepID=A0A845AUY3_9SPHN|nr:TetR/AcrR family transcriptional regulator [Parerythrobacter jejuensis]MXP32885.1 TetR family transcriptional regulator [Parerythrobacter jejuensis]